eukprot:gene19491-11625_t
MHFLKIVGAVVVAACVASTSAQYPTEMQCALAYKTAPPGDLSPVLTPYGRPSPCHRDTSGGGGGGGGVGGGCPGNGQVIVKVNASSVNPVDWKVFESNAGLPIQFPHILGFDLAGIVVECPGCTRLKVGDEVWGDNGALFGVSGKLGAYAQWTMSDEKQLGLKPASYSFIQAAAMPLAGLTSLQAFQKTGAPWKEAGTNVFITAGAGGTGHVAIQMAKAWGGNVTAVGGPQDEAFIMKMGADRFIDYTKDKNVFATVADDSVDVVYDNYGGAGTADQASGYFVFLPGNGGALSKHPKKGVKQINFGFVDSTKYADLDVLKVLADAGKLKPHLQAVFPMSELVTAFNLSMSGTVQGKIGIQIP